MIEYKISREIGKAIAVGLYRDIAAFIKAADKEDYTRFKVEYEARQAARAPPPMKRRQSRNRPAQLR